MEQSLFHFLFFLRDRLPQASLCLVWSSEQVGTRLSVEGSLQCEQDTQHTQEIVQACSKHKIFILFFPFPPLPPPPERKCSYFLCRYWVWKSGYIPLTQVSCSVGKALLDCVSLSLFEEDRSEEILFFFRKDLQNYLVNKALYLIC